MFFKKYICNTKYCKSNNICMDSKCLKLAQRTDNSKNIKSDFTVSLAAENMTDSQVTASVNSNSTINTVIELDTIIS